VIAEYGDWELVSHTFDVRSDGSAILAVIVETKKQRHDARSRSREREAARHSPENVEVALSAEVGVGLRRAASW